VRRTTATRLSVPTSRFGAVCDSLLAAAGEKAACNRKPTKDGFDQIHLAQELYFHSRMVSYTGGSRFDSYPTYSQLAVNRREFSDSHGVFCVLGFITCARLVCIVAHRITLPRGRGIPRQSAQWLSTRSHGRARHPHRRRRGLGSLSASLK
jgi:hypothetical protein